jgi:electron transport complex protein RnfE
MAESIELQEVSSADEFLKGLWRENPIFVQVLGMCPTLAVTNTAENALAMGLGTAFVLLMSSVVVSSIRRVIPAQVRIATFVLIIATFVTAVDYLIQAFDLVLHQQLGAFISLIVVNCLILGRVEAFASRHTPYRTALDAAFASRHTPYRTALDALGMGIGFIWALVCLGAVRELLGQGALFGFALAPAGFQPWIVMLLPSGGFFALAAWLLLFNRIATRAEVSNE